MTAHAWSNIQIDLLLEGLRGCKWNCAGCGIDKVSGRVPSPNETSELSLLLDEMIAAGYDLDHFEIGPTDFMTSDNFIELLKTPGLVELSQRFKMVVLQSTFLEIEPLRLKLLSEAFANSIVNLYVVIDHQQLAQENYLLKIQKNLALFQAQSKLSVGRIDVIFNAFPSSSKSKIDLRSDLRSAVQRTRKFFGQAPWHGVSSSRTSNLNKSRSQVLHEIRWLNEVFNEAIRPGHTHDVNFQYGERIKPTNRAYVWRGGELYYPPILYGHFVNYDPQFLISKPWDLASLQDWERNIVTTQYQKVENKKECAGCGQLGQCINQGVLALMDALETSDCLCPKTALEVYRSLE